MELSLMCVYFLDNIKYLHTLGTAGEYGKPVLSCNNYRSTVIVCHCDHHALLARKTKVLVLAPTSCRRTPQCAFELHVKSTNL
jgi:hypothetical protein